MLKLAKGFFISLGLSLAGPFLFLGWLFYGWRVEPSEYFLTSRTANSITPLVLFPFIYPCLLVGVALAIPSAIFLFISGVFVGMCEGIWVNLRRSEVSRTPLNKQINSQEEHKKEQYRKLTQLPKHLNRACQSYKKTPSQEKLATINRLHDECEEKIIKSGKFKNTNTLRDAVDACETAKHIIVEVAESKSVPSTHSISSLAESKFVSVTPSAPPLADATPVLPTPSAPSLAALTPVQVTPSAPLLSQTAAAISFFPAPLNNVGMVVRTSIDPNPEYKKHTDFFHTIFPREFRYLHRLYLMPAPYDIYRARHKLKEPLTKKQIDLLMISLKPVEADSESQKLEKIGCQAIFDSACEDRWITLETIRAPVRLPDGFTYDLIALNSMPKNKDGLIRLPTDDTRGFDIEKHVVPNNTLSDAILFLLENNEKENPRDRDIETRFAREKLAEQESMHARNPLQILTSTYQPENGIKRNVNPVLTDDKVAPI